MPLLKSGSEKAKKTNFDEFRHGKRFAKIRRKYGKAKANKVMQAAVLSNQRRYSHGRRRRPSSSRSRRR